ILFPHSEHMYLFEETQNRVDGLSAGGILHIISLSGIDGESLGVPYLPVVVEQCGVKRKGFAYSDKWHAKELCRFNILITRLEHTHMGNEISRHIKACHLHAILEVLDIFKHSSGNALGSLSLVISREHTVDVGTVHCPEPLRHVHRKRIA